MNTRIRSFRTAVTETSSFGLTPVPDMIWLAREHREFDLERDSYEKGEVARVARDLKASVHAPAELCQKA